MAYKKIKNDIFLILGILIFALILLIVFKANQKDGKFVKITIDGNHIISYNLEDTVKTDILDGENTNILVIENGEAYIKEADCPDKICVSHRKISHTGETIVCLPHKVVVEITEE